MFENEFLDVKNGNINKLKSFLRKKYYLGGLEVKDNSNNTLLHKACEHDQIEVVNLLLYWKVEVNKINKFGQTPLHIACWNGNEEIVSLLFQNGAHPDSRTDLGETTLHWACLNNRIQVVHLLLQYGVDIDVRDNNGNTPLHWACMNDRFDIVNLLIQKGAQMNLRNHDGNTPLDEATNKCHTSCQTFLEYMQDELFRKERANQSMNYINSLHSRIELLTRQNNELSRQLDNSNQTNDQLQRENNLLRIDINTLNNQLLRSEERLNETNDLKLSIENELNNIRPLITEKESIILNKEREIDILTLKISKLQKTQGIGLNDPHARINQIIRVSRRELECGQFRNLEKVMMGTFQIRHQSVNCALKIASNKKQFTLLYKEFEILNEIERRDKINGNENKYFGRVIYSSVLPHNGRENPSIYWLNEEQEYIPAPMSLGAIVLQRGDKSLADLLKGDIPVLEKHPILEQIVQAVAHLHELNFVHFDLKPENIVYFSSDIRRWKLIDFDSSYDLKNPNGMILHHDRNDIRMTSDYASPEVIEAIRTRTYGIEISPKMDIWSLGMIALQLYDKELWTYFHKNDRFMNILASNVNQEEIDYRLKHELGKKIQSFIVSCLQINPLQRENAKDLLNEKLFMINSSSSTLYVTKHTLSQNFNDIKTSLKQFLTDAEELISEELNSGLSELLSNLSNQFDHVKDFKG